jgi:hypothetical protein
LPIVCIATPVDWFYCCTIHVSRGTGKRYICIAHLDNAFPIHYNVTTRRLKDFLEIERMALDRDKEAKRRPKTYEEDTSSLAGSGVSDRLGAPVKAGISAISPVFW